MNRFSSKFAMSNYQTAVREVAVFIITMMAFSFASTNIARANDDAPATGGGQTVRVQPQTQYAPQKTREEFMSEKCGKDPKTLSAFDQKMCSAFLNEVVSRGGGMTSQREQQCTRMADKIEEAGSKVKEACGKANLGGQNFNRCFDEISACQRAEEDLADTLQGEDLSGENFCKPALANSCPALSVFSSGRDYRAEEKDAYNDRISAKRDLDDLNKEQQDIQRDLLVKKRELEEAAQDAAYEVRKMERKIANDMKEKFEAVGENQKKAFEAAQQQYEQMDVAYIKMRKEMRDSDSIVAKAKDEFNAKCVGAAESAYKAAEASRQAQLRAVGAKKKKNAGSMSRLAGGASRAATNTTRTRTYDYQAFLIECLQGHTGIGKSLANAVAEAERTKKNNDEYLKEQSAIIEQQRASMLKKLQEMDSSAINDQNKIIQATNEAQQELYEEQQRVAQKNQARVQEFQQEQSLRLRDVQTRIATANELMNKHAGEEMLAKRRNTCAGSSGQMSDSRRDRVQDGFNSALDGIQMLHSTCNRFSKTCKPSREPAAVGADGSVTAFGAESDISVDKPDVCVFANDAVNMKSTKKGQKERRPKTHDVDGSGVER